MAKNKVSEWSATPASNTDVGGIDIAEGCAPSGINNAIREMMAQIKDMQAGTDGDSFTIGGNLVVTGTTTLTGGLVTDLPITDGGTGASTASDARTNLGLGTIATQAASNVSITGGSITGITDITVADGGTGASSITANSVILGNGTSALNGNLVAPSTSGYVLTSDGTTWASSPNSIQSATSQATTSGTTVSFTSIPSWVKRITVMFSGVSANGGGDIIVQLGTSGGFVATGYNGQVTTGSGTTTSYSTGFMVANSSAGANTYRGIMTIANLSGNLWVESHIVANANRWGSGDISLSGALTQLRIATTGGDTFDAGSVNIIYE